MIRKPRREVAAVVALVVIALAVRLAYLRDLSQQLIFDGLVLDEANYDAWGLRIAGGDLLGEGTFTANPLAPYHLGLLYACFGRDLLAVRVVQMVAGTLACLVVHRLTRAVSGPVAALVALALCAIYGPFVHTSGNLVAEGWCVLYLAASLAILVRSESAPAHLLAGAAVALAALGRPNLLALLPILPLARELALGAAPVAARAPRLAAWSVGVALVLGPVLLRNIDRGGEAVVVTAHGGVNLWIGNNADADGFFLTPSYAGLQGGQESLVTSSIAVAGRAEGRPLTASESSRWWAARARTFAREHPRDFAALTLNKVRWYLNAYEAPLESNYGWARRESPALGSATLGIGLVGPLAVVGMFSARARWRELAVLYAFVLVYSATVVLTFVSMRYRLPVLVGALPFAGMAVHAGLDAVRAGSAARIVPLAALFAAGVWVFQLPLDDGREARDLAFHEFGLGNVAIDHGFLAAGAQHYEEAIRLYPRRGKFHNALGRVYLRLERPRDAAPAFERALDIGLRERRIDENLARAYADAAQICDAP